MGSLEVVVDADLSLISTVPEMPSRIERRLKNQGLFDDADNEIWWLTVYAPVHDGWRFLNIGGATALDAIGKHARLSQASEVLELCCGLGDTCCYLAGRFGCRVTGIEVNPRQLAGAWKNLRSVHASLSDQVRFIHADTLTWKPLTKFDLVFGMDSLMYLPDRPRVFQQARAALKRLGFLAVTEVLAGPQIKSEARQFMWEKEGVVTLPSPEEQRAMLEDASFVNIRTRDLTPLAVECFETICASIAKHRKRLLALEGTELFNERVADNERYRDFFINKTLVYVETLAEARD